MMEEPFFVDISSAVFSESAVQYGTPRLNPRATRLLLVSLVMNEGVKRIVLVVADQELAQITSFRLELLGYCVDTVGTVEGALSRITGALPDLVITEMELPGLDGTALIERLSSSEETHGLPVMVLSADPDLDCVQTVFDVGACDYLVVPFHMETLEEKVARQVAASATSVNGQNRVAGRD